MTRQNGAPAVLAEALAPDTPSLRAAAAEYAAAGWAVFPCNPRTKAPLTQHGFHDATTDRQRVANWWARHPAALIGAAVPEGVLVLDCDPRHGGRVEDLPATATLRCWSGRADGGCHLYFQRPAFGRFTARRLPGIDLRDAGRGYLIVPPSPHPATGLPYRWEGDLIEPLPPAIRELLRAPDRPDVIARGDLPLTDGAALVRFVGRLPEGDRNNGLFWAACRAAEAGLLDDLADDLIEAARDAGLSAAEAGRVVDSARRAAA